jgi:uroporphyrinogen decarboxylase
VEHPVGTLEQLGSLSVPDPGKAGRMPLFRDVIGTVSRGIQGMMGAYCVGPFTLAAELCGAEDLAMKTITEAGFVTDAISFTTMACQEYGRALAAAGARVVTILEPTAVILSAASFKEYCSEYLRSVAAAVRDSGGFPVLHICGDTTHLLEAMAAIGMDGLSLDHPVDLSVALAAVPEDMLVIGNVDPVAVMMEGEPRRVREAAADLLKRFGSRANYVLGTGCDLPVETPLENVDAFFEAAGWPVEGR